MFDKSKKGKKGSITEESVAALLKRYTVLQVLALLQEVAQVAGDKIDWNKMTRNTATEISGAREYRKLWRHLAYGETLDNQLDDDANSMGDDSDLEYELEAFPSVGREASTESAACVKVLIASGCLKDSNLPNNSTIEAPLTINVPSTKPQAAPSDGTLLANPVLGANISISVFVQNQPLSSGICGEKRPNNGASEADMPPRRKRRGWSAEEDIKLTTAVQKYGERNWANIAREDFKNDRKASELSQRWVSLRKKQGNTNAGTTSQLSETQLAAAHRAMSLALNMPMGDNLKGSSQIDQQLGRSGLGKSQFQMKRPSINPTSTPDSMVKAAAVAAGARIATSADASSLIEAARSQNVVHITTAVNPVIKSSTPGISNQLPNNMHFIRNSLAKVPVSTYSSVNKPNITRPVEAQQAQDRNALNGCSQGHQASTPASEPTSKTQENQMALPSSQVEDNGKKGPNNQCVKTEIQMNLNQNRRHPDLPWEVPDG